MRGSDPEKSDTVAVYNSPSEDDQNNCDDGDDHGSDDDNDDNDNVSTGNGVLPGWFRPRIGRRRLSTREWGRNGHHCHRCCHQHTSIIIIVIVFVIAIVIIIIVVVITIIMITDH